MSDERLLTVEDVAERLSVHPETVRRMLRERKLQGSQPMSRRAGWRIAESELARLIAGAAPRRAASTERPGGPTLERARELAARYRAEGDLEESQHWERIAARIAASSTAAVE